MKGLDTSGRSVNEIKEIELDSFWSAKHKMEIWRVRVFFRDSDTPKLSFFSSFDKGMKSIEKIWKKVEQIEKKT